MTNNNSSQLLLPLPLDDQFSLDNFVAVDLSRRAALAALGSQPPVALLVGAAQSGLSHLLQAFAAEHKGAIYLPLRQFAEFPPSAVLAGLEESSWLLLDDIDAVWNRPDWSEALFALYNSCRDRGASWLSASHTPLAEQSPVLADLRSRLGSGLLFHWSSYSDVQLGELLIERAGRRGLTLTQELVAYLLSRLQRHPAALMAALERLDEHSLQTGRALTKPMARQALGL